MWKVWDKKTDLNGFSPEVIMKKNRHLSTEKTIFIEICENRVLCIQGKNILSECYGIDISLSDEEFIEQIEWLLDHPEEIPTKPIRKESPEEDPDPEPEPAEEPMAAEADEPTEGG